MKSINLSHSLSIFIAIISFNSFAAEPSVSKKETSTHKENYKITNIQPDDTIISNTFNESSYIGTFTDINTNRKMNNISFTIKNLTLTNNIYTLHQKQPVNPYTTIGLLNFNKKHSVFFEQEYYKINYSTDNKNILSDNIELLP